MANKRDQRITLSFMPWRPQLNTSGHQSAANEGDLWRCRNGAPDLDGAISKRSGITQWAQTLKAPDPDATDSTITQTATFLSGTAGFITTDSSSSLVTTNTVLGELRTGVKAGNSNENLLMSFSVPSLPSGNKWSFRFQFRGVNLPAYTPLDTVPNTFSFRVQATAGTGKEFAVWSGGLYWKQGSDSTYVLVTGSERIGAGTWNNIEVRCDDDLSTSIYMNDTLLETLTSADLEDVTLTGTSSFQFQWEVEGSGSSGTQYSTRIATPMYNDTITGPFIATPVTAISGFQTEASSSAVIRSLLCASGDYIFHDRFLEGCWRPLQPKQFANVHFSTYRTNIVWVDSNGSGQSSLFLWDGSTAAPMLQDDAPPGQFVTEHQQRLIMWGDPFNPRRAYYSGDRLPNTWYSPSPDNLEDDFDTLFEAGYKEIDSQGRAIKAIVGDFYGQAVVAGQNGFWKLSGYGPFSYKMDGLKIKSGAANAVSLTQVGNDVWAVGAQGITSVQATQQFGDIQGALLSLPIQNLWSPGPNAPNYINETFVKEARLVYNSRTGFVLIALPLKGDQLPIRLISYSTATQKFYGEWDVDATAITSVEVASPVTEVVMLGNQNGQTGYFNPFTRFDYESNAYTLNLETMSFNGRSLDPKLIHLDKIWKEARLWVVPHGHWDFTATWWTDTDTEELSYTYSQNPDNLFSLDRDFRLDLLDGKLSSGDVTTVIKIDLQGARGRELTMSFLQDQAGEDLAIAGLEIDALVAGYEEN